MGWNVCRHEKILLQVFAHLYTHLPPLLLRLSSRLYLWCNISCSLCKTLTTNLQIDSRAPRDLLAAMAQKHSLSEHSRTLLIMQAHTYTQKQLSFSEIKG